MKWRQQGLIKQTSYSFIIEILQTNSQISGIRIHIQHHKHAKSVPVPLEIQSQDTTNCPVQALLNYIQLRGNMAGPLFLAESKSPISAAQFTAVLCNCVNTIGLDINRYTPIHSELVVHHLHMKTTLMRYSYAD